MQHNRRIEFGIGMYLLISAMLFWAWPAALSPTVYSSWADIPPRGWSIILATVSGLHFAALSLNGRDRLISLACRSAACFMHMSVSIVFGWMFFSAGLFWGCVLFWWLLPFMLWEVTEAALAQFFEVKRGKAARYAHQRNS
jgi:hypothetical protein